MDQEDREYLGREAAFPHELQGRWVEDSDPTLVLVVSGSEISRGGVDNDYVDKSVVVGEDGSVSVEVNFADQCEGDELNLIATGEGDMYAFNQNFVSRYVRITN